MWLTAAVMLALITVLVRERYSPAAAVLGALAALVLLGIVDANQAFLGFANPATITVAGLFIVARAIERHGGLESAVGAVLGEGGDGRRQLARLVLPTALASGIMANTPLVAATAPVVREWCERRGVPASRFLMPLSFAAILGGTLTTIGTSVTLLVAGLYEASTGDAFGLLEITPVGIPLVLVAGTVMVLAAPRLLPNRQTVEQQVLAHERDYSFHLEVQAGGPLDGRTIAEAGLRDLPGVFLARVDRDGTPIAPAGPEQVLQGGDELLFVGQGSAVRSLVARAGLVHSEASQVAHLTADRHGMFEAVVGRGSGMTGRTLKELSFRGRYEAAVLAIHRQGERVEGKLGEASLHPGDALLVQADPRFAERWRDRDDFAVIAPLDDVARPPTSRRALVLGTTLAMVVAAASGAVPILVAVLGACAVLVASGTVPFHQAKGAVDTDVILIIGGAIGLGTAIEASGIAAAASSGLASVAGNGGYLVALAAIVIGTLVMTELITNAAAAALVLPIALDVAERVGADPMGFAVAVAVAASSSYLTPIGYQTNTIVYGLGGYRFTDYTRVGAPVTLAVLVTTLVVIPIIWG